MNEQALLIQAILRGTPMRFLAVFLAYLADFAIFFFFAHRIFEKKAHSFLAVNICSIAAAVLFTVFGFDIYSFENLLGVIFDLAELVFLTISVTFIYKGKFAFKAAYSLIFMTILTASDIIMAQLFISFISAGNGYSVSGNGTLLTLFCVLLRIFRAAVTALLCRYMKRLSAFGSGRYAGVLCYISIFPFCVAAFFDLFSVGNFDADSFILMVFAALFIIAAVILLVRFLPKISAVLSVRGEVLSENVPVDNGGLSPREMQKLRHDVKNNVATINALIDSGDGEEAKRLLSELAERLGNALGGGNKTNISAIDLTVGEKARLCEERGITLDIHAEPLPDTKISPLDLSSVVSNILDNAIEAAEKCEAPVITFKIFKYKSYLAITCENPISKAPRVQNGALATTKEGGGHGFGMEIIKEICQNNNGRYQYEFDDKVFKASAFLEM